MYTVFTMIGDIGGFNGAIIILPMFLLSMYSGRMYSSSIQEEIPVRKSKQSKLGHQDQNSVGESAKLGSIDIGNIQTVASQRKILKVPFSETLFHFGLCCRKSREMRLRKKITQRFDETLDIRSFVSVQTNFATLIRLLLTKE